MTPPMRPRISPPTLDALAEAVARYQDQQSRKRRTTKEVAVRAGKAASGPAIAIAIAVALSQIVQSVWGGGSAEPAADTQTVDRSARHERSLASHKATLEELQREVALCRSSIDRIDLKLAAADAPIAKGRRRKR